MKGLAVCSLILASFVVASDAFLTEVGRRLLRAADALFAIGSALDEFEKDGEVVSLFDYHPPSTYYAPPPPNTRRRRRRGPRIFTVTPVHEHPPPIRDEMIDNRKAVVDEEDLITEIMEAMNQEN